MPDTSSSLERWLKIAGVALTLAGLLAAGYQFSRNQAVEAARPFLEKKLKWCEEAVETAAGIAVFGRESTLPSSAAGALPIRRIDRFRALYYGPMGMVESTEVTNAMIDFDKNLKWGESTVDKDKEKALAIATACRFEMARDWSPVWNR